MMQILSLGAGVQSSAVLLMSCKGILPKLDCAIFADTGWEPKAVYQHLSWLMTEAAIHGIPVLTVSAGNLREDSLHWQEARNNRERRARIPYYILNPDGTHGMVNRQCTSAYKIEPIEEKIRELLGLRKGQRWPTQPVIDNWYGISADEARRMRSPRCLWKRNIYPLCGVPEDLLAQPMRRGDCVKWLVENYPGRTVPRSACIGCPFHSDAEWRRLREESPEEWRDAVEFDKHQRTYDNLNGQPFIHAKRVPLDQVDLSTPEEHGQLNWLNECQGMCGN